jgi:hypothetical protein
MLRWLDKQPVRILNSVLYDKGKGSAISLPKTYPIAIVVYSPKTYPIAIVVYSPKTYPLENIINLKPLQLTKPKVLKVEYPYQLQLNILNNYLNGKEIIYYLQQKG